MSDYPKCPKCGWEDTGGYFECREGSEIECESCGAVFVVVRITRVNDYETELKEEVAK